MAAEGHTAYVMPVDSRATISGFAAHAEIMSVSPLDTVGVFLALGSSM